MAVYSPKALSVSKNGDTYNYDMCNVHYGVCSTNADEQIKEVSIPEIESLTEGLCVRIKFSNAQSYSGQPQLQINSLTATDVNHDGSTASGANEWQAGEVIDFVYDGTNFIVVKNQTKVPNATNGNFASLDSNGNLVDSGHKHSDYLTSHQDISGKADKSSAISNITRSGTTFTATRADGTTFTFTQQDNNTQRTNAEIVNLIYPVGSIYMSVNSTSPATLFGGTWAQLKDRFLLGKGDTYTTNGATGGAASVSYTPAGTNKNGAVSNCTLTVDQIPSHNHSFTGSSATTGNNSVGHTHGLSSHTHTYDKAKSPTGGPSTTSTSSEALSVAQLAQHAHQMWLSGSGGGSKTINASAGAAGSSFTAVSVGGDGSWTAEKIGSGSSHSHTLNSHTHTNSYTSTASGGPSNNTSAGISANHTHTVTAAGSIGNKGGGGAHGHGFTQPTFTGTAATIATMPPYLVVYMWKRTA